MTPQIRSRPAGQRLRRDQIALVVVATIAVPVLVWAGVRLAGRDDSPRPGDLVAPGVSHVHGLGINSADGSLVVATHYGSFRIPTDGDDAERIGDSFQDTMGFTVAGPDHFLGSGHPDVAGRQAGQPGQLGLIESDDAGDTWTSLSLSGEADFHGLAFAHDQVYGWDSGSGRFMVSRDRAEWETRSTLDLYGFAVDPDDAEHVLGVAPSGLTESADGGRTWAEADGPQLFTLSWDAEAGLWGTDPGGIVWHRSGADWEWAGSLAGGAQALLATPDALYAAAHDAAGVTGIYRSTDDGRTWELRYRDTPQEGASDAGSAPGPASDDAFVLRRPARATATAPQRSAVGLTGAGPA
ncbi:MAG: F510_1955 family glycosylhydrolase [Acidimicrobiales bacterium]